MQFTDFSLDQRLLQSLKHMGISTPTAIQEQALPIALAGKDLMASSKTGSGKTLAFLLPALQRVISTRALSKRDPRVLILLPTRELAQQVYSQLRLLVANTQYKAMSILGGENFNDQAKALAKEPHFIVATPGRIADHLAQKHLFLNGLELLILDEADRMLDLGFAPQLQAINEAADHKRRQTLMFSATLDHSEINEIAATLLKNPL
ncbi:MAG: DEAD/DEAH box helicase, partial [Shewanella sp.]